MQQDILLPHSVELDIKLGFFELKPKFLFNTEPTQEFSKNTYISHLVLHQKHPVFRKFSLDTLKELIQLSKFISLQPDESLYQLGAQD